jgi:hypothetical protein
MPTQENLKNKLKLTSNCKDAKVLKGKKNN